MKFSLNVYTDRETGRKANKGKRTKEKKRGGAWTFMYTISIVIITCSTISLPHIGCVNCFYECMKVTSIDFQTCEPQGRHPLVAHISRKEWNGAFGKF